MTQVPEYLLERSRARRAALGLGGGTPSSTPAAAPGSGSDAAPAAPPAAGGAGGAATATLAAPAAAPASAASAAAAAPAAPAAPLPEYVTDPGPRSGIPYWMMPVLLILPLWAIVYMGAFGERASTAKASPQQLYTANCASCHGATGQGGVGPALQGGSTKQTFPDEAAHIAWVENGSSAVKGQPYGSPDRPGGQRIATSGGMPAFKGQLTDEEIKMIVDYERNVL